MAQIWNREIGICLRILYRYVAAVNAVQFKDKYVVLASRDCTIKLCSLESGHCLRTFDGHSHVFNLMELL